MDAPGFERANSCRHAGFLLPVFGRRHTHNLTKSSTERQTSLRPTRAITIPKALRALDLHKSPAAQAGEWGFQ